MTEEPKKQCPYCLSFSIELGKENAHCWDCGEYIEYFDLIESVGITKVYADELRRRIIINNDN